MLSYFQDIEAMTQNRMNSLNLWPPQLAYTGTDNQALAGITIMIIQQMASSISVSALNKKAEIQLVSTDVVVNGSIND